MSYKCLLILFLLNFISLSYAQKFLSEENKQEIIIKYLTGNYNITAVQSALENNPVFPIEIHPYYEGKAKKQFDIIVTLQNNLNDLKKSGAKAELIAKADAFLKKTQVEFDKIKEPFIKSTIESTLLQLLVYVQEPYLNVVLNYMKSDYPDLMDLTSLIANAIVNGNS